MKPAYVHGISYQMGELQRHYLTASGYREVVEANNVPPMPELWGWGAFYETEDAYRLGRSAAQQALQASGVAPDDIELTIFACAYFPDTNDLLYQGTGRILKALGLTRSLIEGQTLTGCAALLSAIQNAARLVESGAVENVLVVGIDRMPRDLARFWDYGLFSDAAASCVVSSRRPPAGLRVTGAARGVELDEILGAVRFNPKNLLHVKTLGRLLEGAGHTAAGVNKVFNNNVYLPIKTQKDMLAGFTRRQMFLDNVPRVGHCLSCDSLINFADFCAARAPKPGECFVFQADGNGCCATLLMEWESARAPDGASN